MDPNEPVKITLSAQQWNLVIMALHEVPKRIADPLIEAIVTQANPQNDLNPRSDIVVPQPPGNGHDTTAAGAA
jgi:hypothetical protein